MALHTPLLLLVAACSSAAFTSSDPSGGERPGAGNNGAQGGDASTPSGSDDSGGSDLGQDAGRSQGNDGGTSSGSSGGGGVAPPPQGKHRLIGYYSSWSTYDRKYEVADLPADKLTHVNYAFANIADGKCSLGDSYADIDKAFPGDTWDQGALRGNFNQLNKLKAAHPQLRTLLSIGGWTWSRGFSDAAATEQSRAMFASSCVELATKYGFDGLDVDWEYPVAGGLEGNIHRPEDATNYVKLMQALRSTLDAKQQALGRGERYLLTIAVGVSPTHIGNLRLAALAESLDWINLMTYDYHGSWDNMTGFNAPLRAQSADPSTGEVKTSYNVEAAVDAFLAAGVSAKKLSLGVPFYGRSWTGVGAAKNGLYQRATGAGPGTWERGVLEYRDIAAKYLTNPAWKRGWDEEAKVPFLHNPTTGEWISYDDPQSLLEKRRFASEKGLGGLMIWEMNCDDGALTDLLD